MNRRRLVRNEPFCFFVHALTLASHLAPLLLVCMCILYTYLARIQYLGSFSRMTAKQAV